MWHLLQYPLMFCFWNSMKVLGPTLIRDNVSFPDWGTYMTFLGMHTVSIFQSNPFFPILFLPYVSQTIVSIITSNHPHAYYKYALSYLIFLTNVWLNHPFVTFFIVHLFIYDSPHLLIKLRGTPIKYFNYIQYFKWCIIVWCLLFLETAYTRISTTTFLILLDLI